MNKTFFVIVFGMYWLVFSCSEDDSPSHTDGGTTNGDNLSNESSAVNSLGEVYQVGFEQQPNNQNPFVEKLAANGDRIWIVNHETTPVDGRAVTVAVDEQDRPWVVFTVDGGSNEEDYINERWVDDGAFTDVFANSYGQGGGPVVSVIARLDPATGKIVKGTFITARLTNGNTNTLRIESIGFSEGNVIAEATSAAWPPGAGTSYERMPDITDEDRVEGSFLLYYELTLDLSTILVGRLR